MLSELPPLCVGGGSSRKGSGMDGRGEEPLGNHQQSTSPLSLTPDDGVIGGLADDQHVSANRTPSSLSGVMLVRLELPPTGTRYRDHRDYLGKGSRSSFQIDLTAKSRSFSKILHP